VEGFQAFDTSLIASRAATILRIAQFRAVFIAVCFGVVLASSLWISRTSVYLASFIFTGVSVVAVELKKPRGLSFEVGWLHGHQAPLFAGACAPVTNEPFVVLSTAAAHWAIASSPAVEFAVADFFAAFELISHCRSFI
jgi:hypothetical protein